MEALRRANDIRSARARLKEKLRSGELCIVDVLIDPPVCVHTAKVLDLLLAVPKYGRVKSTGCWNAAGSAPPRRSAV